MTKRSYLLFIAVFLLSIYCVGIVQAVVELKRGETVQFLDIFEDTFVAPYKRRTEIADLLGRLRTRLDTVEIRFNQLRRQVGEATAAARDTSGEARVEEPDYYEAERAAEEALFAAQDIRKRVVEINRHISLDTTRTEVLQVDSLVAELDELFNETANEEDVATLLELHGNVRADLERLARSNPPPGITEVPAMALEHFIRYTWMNRRYLRAYEGEIEETSVFANTLRPPMQFVRYALLHDLGEKGVLGRKGWFFYKPGFDYLVRPYMLDPRAMVVDYNDVALVDNPVAAITTFEKQLNDRGIELLVVIVPGKPTVYPDLITPNVPAEQSCKLTHSLRAMEDLREAGIEVVDLFEPFAEERARDTIAGDSMYLAKDTHWKARGVKLAAREVARRIREYSWYTDGTTEYRIDTVTVARHGDVGTMTTLPDFSIRELQMSFAAESTTCYRVYGVKRDEEGNIIAQIPYRDEYIRSEILVLGDSFSRIYQTDAPRSAGWISHLARELSQPLASIVNDGGASTLVRQTLARKQNVLRNKKLVVWEFVERDFRYGAEGWKDVDL